ncbi:MAG: hypothetical protein GY898_14665 [Proteobacteria bacterium]|nr:hypothetical protein [Pseudomonadota bacterium]
MRWLVSVAFAVLMGCGGGGSETTSTADPTTPEPEVAVQPSTGHETPSDSARLTVVFTNNIDGEIEPCG